MAGCAIPLAAAGDDAVYSAGDFSAAGDWAVQLAVEMGAGGRVAGVYFALCAVGGVSGLLSGGGHSVGAAAGAAGNQGAGSGVWKASRGRAGFVFALGRFHGDRC